MHTQPLKFTFIPFVACFALSLGACGDDEDAGSSVSVNQGIYELTARTVNDGACDMDGETVLETSMERYFAVSQEAFIGFPIITAQSCSTPEQCRGRIAETDDSFAEWKYFLGEGTWEFSRSPPFEGDTCNGTGTNTLWKETENDGMRIERRSHTVEGLSIDAEGFCNTDVLDAGLDQYPCVRLEVFSGTKVEEL